MYRRVIHRRYQKKRFILLFLVLAAILTATYFLSIFTYDFLSKDKSYDKIIKDAAIRHNLDPYFLKAVIWRESRFKASIRGRDGEIGLMQIIRKYAVKDWEKEHNVKISCDGILYDPRLNIEIGAWYLSRALKRWERYEKCDELALCEYNAGLTRTRKWKPNSFNGTVVNRITIKSTKKYVKTIIKKYEEYLEKREVW